MSVGVLASAIFWLCGLAISDGFSTRRHELQVPFLLCVFSTLLLLAIVQLLPSPFDSPSITTDFAQSLSVDDEVSVERVSNSTSIYPWATALQAARITIVGLTCLLGANLFLEPRLRLAVYTVISLNGLALGVFGIFQKLTWNGMIYWSIPLRFGGQPFGPFVNRNTAGGYLNLCLAAAVGGYVAVMLSRDRNRSRIGWIIFFALSIAVCFAAVLSTTSRGAILALLIAVVVTAPLLRLVSGKGLVVGVGLVAIAVFAVIGVGFGPELGKEISSVRDIDGALLTRYRHWQDTIPATKDFPVLGSGLGTYKYANLPYQNEVRNAWHHHADNMYLEVLIEGGLVTCLIVAALIGFIFKAIIRTTSLLHDVGGGDVAIASLLAIVCIIFQQVTDFGITILSQSLLAALLFGILGSDQNHLGLAFAIHRGWVKQIFVGVIAIATLGAVVVIQAASTSEQFRNSVPIVLDAAALPEAQHNELLARGELLQGEYPFDAELHKTVGDLWVYKFRHETLSLVKDTPANNVGTFWERTQLENFYQLLTILPASRRESLQSSAPIAENLQNANAAYQSSLRSCQWSPNAPFRTALTELVLGTNGPHSTLQLQRAAILQPNRINNLKVIATVADRSGRTEIGDKCWSRVLKLDGNQLKDVINIAARYRSDTEIVRDIIEDPEQLVISLKELEGPSVRDIVKLKIESASAEGGSTPAGYTLWMNAQISKIAGDLQESVESIEAAVAKNPLQLEWRIELAQLLIEMDRFEEAVRHINFVSRIRPNHPDINRLNAKIESDGPDA